MQMPKILIVDDEDIIREGLQKKINRLFPDCFTIFTAPDAVEGLDIIKQNIPDIIITDIRMPEIDGLKFIEIVKSIHKHVKFVIISGYQDFDYARAGIKLGVEDYLVKPVDNMQLKQVILNLKQKIEYYYESNQYIADLKEKAFMSSYLLAVKYLTDLTTCYENSDNQYIDCILNNLRSVDICFDKKYFTVISLAIHSIDRNSLFSLSTDVDLLNFCICNISQEMLSEYGYAVAFKNYSASKIICIILNTDSFFTQSQRKKLCFSCHNLLDTLKSVLGVHASAGIGKTYEKICDIPSSYTESYYATMQKIISEEKIVSDICDIDANDANTFLISDEKKLLIKNTMLNGDFKRASILINELFENAKVVTIKALRTFYMDIALFLMKVVQEAGTSWEIIIPQKMLSENFLHQINTLDELRAHINHIVEKICQYVTDIRKSDGKKIINDISKYIDSYYYYDINLNALSAKYYINPCYLSQLFKMEKGINFSDYLSKIRMQKAAELLKNTDIKTHKIAEMVGYKNPRYFSELFQKHMGITPTEYRKKTSFSGESEKEEI